GAAPGLRPAVFHAVSLMPTPGYATSDYAAWSEPAQAVLITLMLVGGSAGSASGGVKVLRWLIIAKNTFREVRRVLHPRAVLPVRLGKALDRKSTRLNSSHVKISYAVFCLKKKKK